MTSPLRPGAGEDDGDRLRREAIAQRALSASLREEARRQRASCEELRDADRALRRRLGDTLARFERGGDSSNHR